MPTTISVYSIPPLISMVFLFSLSIVSYFSGKGGSQWKMLSIFSLLLGMATLFTFLATRKEMTISEEHLRIVPLFAIFSIIFAIMYSNILTGKGQFKVVKLFGKNIPVWFYFLLGLILWSITLYILKETHLFINNIERINATKFQIKFGPISILFLFILVTGLGKILFSLNTAFRKTKDKIFREYLFLNIIAFRIIYGSVISLIYILPLFRINWQIYVFFAFPIGVVIFYVAILRYQFGMVEELNENLETKVKERTTELENTQSLLVESKTMASVGQLAAGIAHEINNPIGAVKSMQQSVKSATDKLESLIKENYNNENDNRVDNYFKVLREANRVTEDGTRRITEIVKAMRNFANLDEAETQLFDVHEGLEDTIRLVKSGLDKNIEIITKFNKVPKILCSPAKLNQVFWNIMLNAKEAIISSGAITVSTNSDQKNVIITFKDTGRGISKDDLEHIFEPGFTTKSSGIGTGLGLSICYKIVCEHNGNINVNSKPDQGTEIILTFPIKK